MEGISSHLKKLWEEWELRAVVLLSLTIQVLLTVLGRQRKYRPNTWLKVSVWSCYMVADAAAIYALGKIATRLKQMRGDLGHAANGLDPNTQMTAFWAPFLLLHLGGPDTITAYALEDNELWMRHILRLVVQTVWTLLICFQALTGSDLSLLSLLMIVSGLIKYGERVYVLWAASNEQFMDSIPDPPVHNLKILEEYKSKEAEGYDITPYEVIELCRVNIEHNSEVNGDLLSPDGDLLSNELKNREPGWKRSKCAQSLSVAARGTLDSFRRLFGDKDLLPEDMSKRNRAELAVAKDLIDIFRRLFADLLLSFQDSSSSQLILTDKHFHVVFRVIEIELGLMYNLLYTKALAIHNRWGFTLRTMSILFTSIVLVFFNLSDKDKYSRCNIFVTFLLLWVAIFLEIYALFVLLFSDEAACWLKDHRPAILDFVERVQPLYNRRRWSGSMGQCSLLSFALKKKHLACHRILEFLHVDQKVLKFLYKGDVKVEDFLKERITMQIKFQARRENEVPFEWTNRGEFILGQDGLLEIFKWSIELEFDQSILVWHTATQLLCHLKDPNSLKDPSNLEMSKHLSRYMLYLLIMHPFLLPIGAGHIKFRNMNAGVMSFFEEQKSTVKTNRPETCLAEESAFNIAKAFVALHEDMYTLIAPTLAKGDKSKFAVYHGCRLASQLDKVIHHDERKWYVISSVWVEMLAYAAGKCKGHDHARQLRRGGEFLTHVWLLMAHFGLTNHFQIPNRPAITELLVKQE